MALCTRRWPETAVSASTIYIQRPPMTLDPSLSLLVVTLGLRGAQKRALEGTIFRRMGGLERLKHGTVDAEMVRSGCICVRFTHTEALDDSGTLLVFVGGDFGLEGG